MGTNLIKCGISQQVILSQPVHIILISPNQPVENVWNNKTGQAYKVPFNLNKNLHSFFQPLSFPIKGNFDDYMNFTIDENQENILPCFLTLRSLFGADGYQNSGFKIQDYLSSYSNINHLFKDGHFDFQELDHFQYWQELSQLMQKTVYAVMFNNVPCFNPYNTLVSQAHFCVIADNTYQKILIQHLQGCTQIPLEQNNFKIYSDYVNINCIFQEVYSYLQQYPQKNNHSYFNQLFNLFSKLYFCSVSLFPIVSANQDYENATGIFLKNLTD